MIPVPQPVAPSIERPLAVEGAGGSDAQRRSPRAEWGGQADSKAAKLAAGSACYCRMPA